jgi:hypothetical protein
VSRCDAACRNTAVTGSLAATLAPTTVVRRGVSYSAARRRAGKARERAAVPRYPLAQQPKSDAAQVARAGMAGEGGVAPRNDQDPTQRKQGTRTRRGSSLPARRLPRRPRSSRGRPRGAVGRAMPARRLPRRPRSSRSTAGVYPRGELPRRSGPALRDGAAHDAHPRYARRDLTVRRSIADRDRHAITGRIRCCPRSTRWRWVARDQCSSPCSSGVRRPRYRQVGNRVARDQCSSPCSSGRASWPERRGTGSTRS